MPMRVIAKKRCRAMVEPPEKGERPLYPVGETKPSFSDGAWAAVWLLLVEEGSVPGLVLDPTGKSVRRMSSPLCKNIPVHF
jgi:hypothetical protein